MVKFERTWRLHQMAGVSSARRERTISRMRESPKILAIETSGRIGAVALARGADLERTAEFRADHNHAVELLPTISRLCTEAGWNPGDLEHLYLSIGPGSFTGLRIAVTLARTLALAVQVKIVAVSTLKVLAQNALLAPKPPPALGGHPRCQTQSSLRRALRTQPNSLSPDE